MKKLPKYLLHDLDQLARGGKTRTITMTEDYLTAATKLQDLGLVSLIPRLAKRGRFKGMHVHGSDYVVTPAGLKVLARELPPRDWESTKAVVRWLEEIKK